MEQKLETVLSELATKLGTSVDKLYELTIKQAKIELFGKIVQGILFVLLIISLIIFSNYLSGKKFETGGQYTEINGWGITAIITGICDVMTVIIVAVEMGNYIRTITTLISNPEYWAFTEIISYVRNN